MKSKRGFLIASLAVVCCCSSSLAYRMFTAMAPMTDGTLLATDIYWPDHGYGPWPVLLFRTPFDKSRYESSETMSTTAGFAVAIQDERGRFASQGQDSVWFDDGWGESRDGYDTIEWIAAQTWCNGKVETHGYSAMGINQALTAGSAPPHLVCQWIGMAAPSLYLYLFFFGGIFRASDMESYLNGEQEGWFLDDVIAHPNYDPFWIQVDAQTREQEIVAPSVHVGGWFDIMLEGTLASFTGRQHNGGERARGNQILIMGPWIHEGMESLVQGELPVPENSRFSTRFSNTYGDWVYYWMDGQPTGIMDQPRVHYYVIGDAGNPGARGNEWRDADDWPVTDAAVPLYLHSDGSLTWFPQEAEASSRTFSYDPTNPVPTIGGGNITLPGGSYDQCSVEGRADVLIYETEVLTEPVEVVGQIKAKLFLSSDCPDTDLTAKLTDVYPDGRSMLILDGGLRVRHRFGLDHEDFLTPGEVAECEVDLWSTAIAFDIGHRVRLAVSSSNAPRFDPNPNTGHPFRADDETRIAANSIHSSLSYPSRLILPLTYPVFTPTPTFIPTPSPTAASTPPLGVRLQLATDFVHPGEQFWVGGYLDNPSYNVLTRVPVFFVLEVAGALYFWPSWRLYDPSDLASIDFQFCMVPHGSDEVQVVPVFTWPETGNQAVTGLTFFGMMVTEDFTAIVGETATADFGYGP